MIQFDSNVALSNKNAVFRRWMRKLVCGCQSANERQENHLLNLITRRIINV